MSVDRIGKPSTKPTLNICEETDVENLYHDVLSGLVTEEELTRVLEIIRSISAKGKPDYKYEIHQALVKEFTQSRGSRIYNSCKSIIEYEHAE